MKRLYPLFAFVLLLMVLLNIETTWAQPEEAVFNFTGGQQSFVVPPNVFIVHIQAWGAQGSDATGGAGTGLGGLGGFAEGYLAVTPGQTLEIFVGGRGLPSTGEVSGGGFNGGGDARGLGADNTRGGGGGASDVRVGENTLDDRVIVAGGGGGASSDESLFGGVGGGLTGGNGAESELAKGGTQNSGGEGGNLCPDGGFGFGGSNPPVVLFGCAGGGGGWYGGGSGIGAGGGSSYIDGVRNGSTTSGIKEGEGMIILTFSPAEPIPTLSEWGLIALAIIFGLIGIMVMRKRKVIV